MLLNARSSNSKVNTAIETNSKCTQFFIDLKSSITTTREAFIISQKIEGFGGRPPVGGMHGARAPLNPALLFEGKLSYTFRSYNSKRHNDIHIDSLNSIYLGVPLGTVYNPLGDFCLRK